MGISPLTIEEMCLDQLYCLWLDKDSLKAGALIQKMGVNEAIGQGLIKPGPSLWAQAKERNARLARGEPDEGSTKRARRKWRREQLKKQLEKQDGGRN
jgi:hypothetical protein